PAVERQGCRGRLPSRSPGDHPHHGGGRHGPPGRAGALLLGGAARPEPVKAGPRLLPLSDSFRRTSAMSTATADIGLIGLAVMGKTLVLTRQGQAYPWAVYTRTQARVDDSLAGRARGKRITGCHSVKDLVAALKRPRKVMLMVKAGPAVDQVIEEVAPLLEPGDILIDGGNTHYPDRTRRTRALREKRLRYIENGAPAAEGR